MLGPFRPLEEYVGPSILAAGAPTFIVLLGCMLTFSLEFVYQSFDKNLIQIWNTTDLYAYNWAPFGVNSNILEQRTYIF
jgi:hypothetical protein